MLFGLFELNKTISIIQEYVIAILCTISFLIIFLTNKTLSTNIRKKITWGIIFLFFYIIFEILERMFALLSYPTFQRQLLSCLLYMIKPYIGYFIADIACRNISQRIRLFNKTPLILNVILSIVAIFTNIYCYFDKYNIFQRGSLNFIPFVVGIFYLIELMIIGLINFKKKDWLESIISIVLSIVVTITVAIEVISSNHGLLPTVSIFAIIVYYIFFITTRFSHDELTHALLRNSFFVDVEAVNEPTYLCLFDIDDISVINNDKGYEFGDKTIANFANSISVNLPKKAYLYRIGGDDFAILFKTNFEKDITDLMTRIEKSTNEYNIKFTSSYAFFKTKDDFKKAFSKAEQDLIKKKRYKYTK